MPLFTKESLELLRNRVDLVDVIAAHVDLKRSGAAFKANCPFHEEKTPSFTIQRGDTHYHCYGCGAHGDSIQFLIDFQKMTFTEAVEYLASRFQVPLEQKEQLEASNSNKSLIKEALESACRFYNFFLLHTVEGKEALQYLYDRGIDLDFIRYFQIGLAPKTPFIFKKYMHSCKFSQEVLLEAGLIAETKRGDLRDFFSDRITFPIRNPSGACIGFSARKYKEDTFGGKYINTAETLLFKKSSTLFGLNYSRRRIAKEKRVIIVEGQIDALRLIQEGFNITVASLGTAFTENHVKEMIHLGVNTVYLALDSDNAGQEAAIKTGDLFQKEGIEVYVLGLHQGKDPDEILKEEGPYAFLEIIEESVDYLTFLVRRGSEKINKDSPAGKTELVQYLSSQIRNWKQPVMVHESLKKLCKLLDIPETALGVAESEFKNQYIKKRESAGLSTIDADLIMEMDLVRWLLLIGQNQDHLVEAVKKHLNNNHFTNTNCQHLYLTYMDCYMAGKKRDLLSLAIALNDEASQLMMSQILEKKVNKEKIEEGLIASIQKLLEREWMQKREDIRLKIHSGQHSEDDVLELAKAFDTLKKNQPKVSF
jgi:DNA primase